MTSLEELKNSNIFPLGEENSAYQDYFVGQSYLEALVNDPESFDVNVGHVTFEPGCRNNWHTHVDGYQIILVTGGQGWYQAEGEAAQRLEPGDVVAVPRGVNHWHGATADSWFSHLAITKGMTEWHDPVTDEEYNQL